MLTKQLTSPGMYGVRAISSSSCFAGILLFQCVTKTPGLMGSNLTITKISKYRIVTNTPGLKSSEIDHSKKKYRIVTRTVIILYYCVLELKGIRCIQAHCTRLTRHTNTHSFSSLCRLQYKSGLKQ